ncbi:5-formyltetrahydrofolate cyclo-ligase [Aquimarina agarilytica]|uniref:5-formyltetrahydrofolate cyclo-ligase n=1 Tax=Aquimarina agarilytica TaxID=1087449 RepID=UPI000289AAC3|nr:5-formyltetrahydrofolate cyclo-ligase [Aquimarina agarilytica]
MTKKELRKKYKQLRAQFTPIEIEEKSIAIANQLLQLNIWEHQYYHIFLPISTQNEIDTEFILHILQGKDKHIVISKSNFSDGSLSHFLLTDQTILSVNKWGIPEPNDGIPIPDNKIDVVFVPLLAFDTQGNRVGYGKGFYDRFLASSKPKLCVGLSFFEAETKINDVDIRDVPLDYCTLPDKTYNFI